MCEKIAITLALLVAASLGVTAPASAAGVGFDGAGINWENRVHSMSYKGC